MNERTEAMLETAKPFVAGLLGAVVVLTLIHFVGLEWVCIGAMLSMFSYLVYSVYKDNLERIQTLKRIRNEKLIDSLKSDSPK